MNEATSLLEADRPIMREAALLMSSEFEGEDEGKDSRIPPLLRSWAQKYKDDPVAFSREVLLFDPYPFQAELMDLLNQTRRVAVKGVPNSGKTAVAGVLLLWFLCTRPFCKIPCIGPKAGQVKNNLWSEATGLYYNAPALHSLIEANTEAFRVKAARMEWYAAITVSSAPVDPVTQERSGVGAFGFHAKHLLVILDEAVGVPEHLWKAVRNAMMADEELEEVLIFAMANPVICQGSFYQIFKQPETHGKGWATYTVDAFTSPRVSKSAIDEIRATYGEESMAWMTNVLAEFPEGAVSDTALPYAQLYEACYRDPGPLPGDPLTMGVDVARHGKNETVITVARGLTLVEMIRLSNQKTEEVAGAVLGACRKWHDALRPEDDEEPIPQNMQAYAKPYGVSVICVDAPGLGWGVVDRLNEEIQKIEEGEWPWYLRPKVAAIETGKEPTHSHKKKVFNLRSQVYFMAREALIQGRIDLTRLSPKNKQDFINQAVGAKYRYRSDGKWMVETKEDMARRGVASPDLWDSAALAFLLKLIGGEAGMLGVTSAGQTPWARRLG